MQVPLTVGICSSSILHDMYLLSGSAACVQSATFAGQRWLVPEPDDSVNRKSLRYTKPLQTADLTRTSLKNDQPDARPRVAAFEHHSRKKLNQAHRQGRAWRCATQVQLRPAHHLSRLAQQISFVRALAVTTAAQALTCACNTGKVCSSRLVVHFCFETCSSKSSAF